MKWQIGPLHTLEAQNMEKTGSIAQRVSEKSLSEGAYSESWANIDRKRISLLR